MLAFFETRQPGKDVRKDTCMTKFYLPVQNCVIIKIQSKTEN